MADEDVDPAIPAESGQDAASQQEVNTPDGGSPEEGQGGAEGASDVPSADELAKLSLADRSRVEGIVKAYQRKISETENQKRELSELTAAIREQSASIDRARPAEPSGPPKDELDELLESVNPAERAILAKYAAGLERRFELKYIRPVEARVAQDSAALAWDRAKMKYQDFDDVMKPERLRSLPRGINDPDAAYRLLKYEDLSRDHNRTQTELSKLQRQQKLSAGTERPGGPSADSLLIEEYDNLPFEQRRKMTSEQLLKIAERKLARR